MSESDQPSGPAGRCDDVFFRNYGVCGGDCTGYFCCRYDILKQSQCAHKMHRKYAILTVAVVHLT